MIKGMDISYWQGTVDFAKVAADGITFAILREGYSQTVDKKFSEYVAGCIPSLWEAGTNSFTR